tara:strand:- start:168 stop:671 length:504 start_codon:yes stop_codon:yes gene_type:complete
MVRVILSDKGGYMESKFWLMKSEPKDYSFDDLKSETNATAEWDGVRNYQARNLLRDSIKSGDRVIFYHSNSKPSGAVGTAVVVRDGYPDFTAWDPDSDHPDPRSTEEDPLWFMVDIKADQTFERVVSLKEIKATAALSDMVLVKNSRLSVQPVTEDEFQLILTMGLS